MSTIADMVNAELDDERRPEHECGVCWALARMPESERRGAERGLSSTISRVKMADILTANGYPTSASAVGRHRQRGHTA